MRLFDRTDTLKEPPPETETALSSTPKSFAEIIAEVLHERVPSGTVPDPRQAVEIAGPDIVAGLELFHRRRILLAVEALPLEALSAEIRASHKPVRVALENFETISSQAEVLRAQETELAASGDFDPAASAELRGKISALQSRLGNATPLRRATETLISTLETVGVQIHSLARLQDDPHRLSRPIGSWFGSASHQGVSEKVLGSPAIRAKRILEISDAALAEIERLRRGELPTLPKDTHSSRRHVSLWNVQFWIED